ncbi:MAG: glycosyltransferase family 4 protein [Candidatus Pacebacteria bacterium]|nr:glycosyltransferase family 4 protein [Candidatus Paceibacterota bacterium]
MKVISIGYGKKLFTHDDLDLERLKLCADEVESFDLVVFTLKSEGLVLRKVTDKLTLYPTDSKNKLLMIFDAVRIGRKITAKKDFLITTQDPFETGLVGMLIRLGSNMPLVVQEHADFFSTNFWKQESFGNAFRFYLGRFILKHVTAVRVVSERIRRTVLKINPSAKTSKLPVAIDVSKFTSVQSAETEPRYFKSGTFIFLSVARFVKQKNIPLMLSAFSRAYKKNPNIRLLLVGSGPLQSEIECLLQKYFPVIDGEESPVKLLSWTNDVPSLMQNVNAYLLTSNYEGWARVLIEAMCSNLPAVTTDVGCVNELLIHHEHGLVVPVNDKEALEQAIHKISADQELYVRLKNNLKQLDKNSLAGADIQSYGKQWVKTLEMF